jgi:excisionase family DNA binding protein
MSETTTRTPPTLHDVEGCMERLKVRRSTVFKLIETNQLRSVKVGRRRLVSEAALCEFIERLDGTHGVSVA